MGYTMYIPTKVLFGVGKLNELHTQKMPGQKALLVLSAGKSAQASGALDRTVHELTTAGVKVVIFNKVKSNPVKKIVMEGADVAREEKCDFVVALGGGSVIDAAKAVALMAVNAGDYWDYITSGSGKRMAVDHKPLPIIAITTTAGTGSEVDAACVITNEETHEKTGFGMPDLFPLLAIVDPQLMLTIPPKSTAYQGFDALFHSTECCISNKANLLGDMYALTAIKNIAANLQQAVDNGGDLHARTKLAFSSTLSGAVMTISGCTSEHSLEHALSAYHEKLPHGAGLIMIAKAYYGYFIEQHCCDQRFISMAQAMGLVHADKPEDFLTALDGLMQACGVAKLQMSTFGIRPAEFPTMAENAQKTMGRLFLNDRIDLTQKACVKIYQESYR